MKRKWINSAVVAATIVMSMTACGDGSESPVIVTQEQNREIVSEPVLSETESAILDYELRYSHGEFTMEDYQALAALYQEQGLIRKQRDMLEQSYRLYDDKQAFEALQTISVNLAEEEKTVQEQAKLMLQNLELEEYLNESVNLISSAEWFDTMMPKLYEGSRSYFLQREDETVLFIQVGYDQTGEPYSNVWYLGEQVKVLRQSRDAVQLLVAQLADGAYQGAFESWMCDGSTGDIYHETGTFNNGVLTGDYTAAIRSGSEAGEVYSLWSNREGMEYTTYTGHFNEQGITTLEQPADKKIQSLIKNTDDSTCVVYAYDESGNKCLFEGLTEGVDKETYAFTIEEMGWKALPSFAVYEVVREDTEREETDSEITEESAASEEEGSEAENSSADSSDSSEIKVRIFDGEIQVYQGSVWVSMGTVEQYANEDPFLVYENSRQTGGSNTANGTEAGEEADSETQSNRSQNGLSQKRTQGEIPKDAVKTTTKPATQKPAQTTQEQTPAETTQEQTQQTPSDSGNSNNSNANNNSTNNSGGNSSNSGNAGSNNNSSTDNSGSSNNSGSSDSGNAGNDVDIEWTDDIL